MKQGATEFFIPNKIPILQVYSHLIVILLNAVVPNSPGQARREMQIITKVGKNFYFRLNHPVDIR